MKHLNAFVSFLCILLCFSVGVTIYESTFNLAGPLSRLPVWAAPIMLGAALLLLFIKLKYLEVPTDSETPRNEKKDDLD